MSKLCGRLPLAYLSLSLLPLNLPCYHFLFYQAKSPTFTPVRGSFWTLTERGQLGLIFLLTNYLPKIDASDDGFNERTICIEWPVKFVQNPTKEYERKIDHQMAKKLAAEASGILAFLVRGCMDVIANGLRVPEKVKQYTREQIESFFRFFQCRKVVSFARSMACAAHGLVCAAVARVAI